MLPDNHATTPPNKSTIVLPDERATTPPCHPERSRGTAAIIVAEWLSLDAARDDNESAIVLRDERLLRGR